MSSRREERIRAARKNQEEVAEHLAARLRGMQGMSDLERAARGLPLDYKKPDVVPEGYRVTCQHCGEQMLERGWDWCAEAQKNLRSWGHKIVDGKLVR